jgi:hypothetical protein
MISQAGTRTWRKGVVATKWWVLVVAVARLELNRRKGLGWRKGGKSEGGWAAKDCVARENGSPSMSRWKNRKSSAGKDVAGKDVAGKDVAREEWSLGSILVLYAGQGRQQSVNLKA